MPTESSNSYDMVPYDSHPFAQTHPDRLATVGTLLGLNCARVNRCRVLELGCAAGGNIIPLALALPESAFVGIDLSKVQVAEGQELMKTLALKNIEMKHLSIMDVGPELGKFDYIICHGVYSWVPNQVREKILDIFSRNLAQSGIGYVSYNTYPGWHMRGMIRDILAYHARQFIEPKMKIKQARNFLDFLAKSVTQENNPFTMLLKQELESFHRSSDSYLYHEHLEDVNDPIYFYQFADRAASHGLKYLAEVDLRVMMPGNYPPEIENVLQMLSQDLLHMEQYMDFLRNRMFRQTLVCHKSQNPNYMLKWDGLQAFHVASSAKPSKAQPEIESTEVEKFETTDKVTLESRDPLVKAAMVCLSEIWPRSIPFSALLKRARERLQSIEDKAAGKDEQTLGQAFLTFYVSASTSLLELYLHPPEFVTEITEKPEAWPLARLQATKQDRVTNLRHESVFLGDFGKQLIRFLDGTRNRIDLIPLLADLVNSGELRVEKDGRLITEKGQIEEIIGQAVDNQLQTIARSALLIK